MFYGCSLCDHSFAFDAVEKGYLHRVGKLLICEICIAELGEALGLDIKKETVSDVDGQNGAELSYNTNCTLI